MPSKNLRRSICLITASLMVTAALSTPAGAAENTHRVGHTHANRAFADRGYAAYRHAGPRYAGYAYGRSSARGATLPYGPEYGFLRRLPPNAIVGPGYTFVPGVGILGESCDLPSSACTNEYRDVK